MQNEVKEIVFKLEVTSRCQNGCCDVIERLKKMLHPYVPTWEGHVATPLILVAIASTTLLRDASHNYVIESWKFEFKQHVSM